MAYQANFKVYRTDNSSIFKIVDISVGDEQVLTRVIKVKRTDFTEETYTFEENENFVNINIPKDSAIHAEFVATVEIPNEDSKYSTIKEFITKNFLDIKMSKRFTDLKVKGIVNNRTEHINITNELSFFAKSAEDRVRFSDLKGAQDLLDYANNTASNY